MPKLNLRNKRNKNWSFCITLSQDILQEWSRGCTESDLIRSGILKTTKMLINIKTKIYLTCILHFLYCSDYEKLTLKFYVETENFQNYFKRIITDHKLKAYVKINTLRNIFDNIYIKPYMETVTCLVQLWLNSILMIGRLVKKLEGSKKMVV